MGEVLGRALAAMSFAFRKSILAEIGVLIGTFPLLGADMARSVSCEVDILRCESCRKAWVVRNADRERNMTCTFCASRYNRYWDNSRDFM